MPITPVRNAKGLTQTPQRPRPMSRGQRVSAGSLANADSSSKPESGRSPAKGQGNDRSLTEEIMFQQDNNSGLSTNGVPLTPVRTSKQNGGPKSPSKSESGPPANGRKVSNGHPVDLPNQPTPVAPLITEPVVQTSSSPTFMASAVKWKSAAMCAAAATDKLDPASRELALTIGPVERNESSLTCNSTGGGLGDSPRNLLSAAGSHAGENDRGKSPSERKLSLGDFVTDTVHVDHQSPVKWDTLESTNGLLNSLPYVPVSVAYVCLIMNVIIPGSGTILAGVSVMCCGEPRGQTKPDELFGQFTTNIFVGVSQFFTVTFFLAGWIWSITWGVYLVLFAEEHRIMKAEEVKRNKTAAITHTLWDR